MAYSFVEIEKHKTYFIAFLTILLIIIYFATIWITWLAIKNYSIIEFKYNGDFPKNFFIPSFKENVFILVIAIIVALIHFFISTNNMSNKIFFILKVEPLDLSYSKHKQLKNIIDEISIATGGSHIEGCVINTASCNAFSTTDFGGKAYIGVTEGLLSKLNRSQLEAVVAHEAAHIVSGDSFYTTVACSMFGIYKGLLTIIREGLARRGTSIGAIIGLFLYGIIWFMSGLNNLVTSLISQQSEFRADAVAVKLTRNPLALAESLYIISKSWRGRGTVSEAFSALFIVETKDTSEVLSHPPIEERINILLNMAHLDHSVLDKMIEAMRFHTKNVRKDISANIESRVKTETQKGWFIFEDNKWQGPFVFSELAQLNWLTPNHLVRRDGVLMVKKAFQDSELVTLFKPLYEEKPYKYSCPHCYHGLEEIKHEGASAYRCPICKGLFVFRGELNKILIREEEDFPEEIYAQAEIVKKELQERFHKIQQIQTPFVLNCPKCGKKMRRRLFSYYAPVEIDVCIWCDMFWFDRNELDLIQVLYDQNPNKDEIIE
ncbi:MAG: zinc metalloprotease HtpX [Candidatus Omnitrophica bacterium]|nr:zinc metalloprotease HtpX [Candidatus Omnitrophota bacterium]